MPGALVQVIARGNQDAYLTSKPQVTNWKAVYKRHTIFASESVEQVFNGTGDFGKKVVCTLQKTGDLASKMYLRVKLPALGEGQCWCPRVGFALLKYLELRVGGTPCEKQDGSWYNIRYELEKDLNKVSAFERMIGDTAALTVPSLGTPEHVLWIPLNFFCCRVDGLAIPLIATQYHDTQLEIEFNPLSQLVCGPNAASATGSMLSCSLFVDFIYLGNVERKKFAESTHEYLIEQVQTNNGESVTSQSQKFRIDFNHPSKALHVVVQQDKYTTGRKFLAWNPKNWDETRAVATKRAALSWGVMNCSGVYVAHDNVADADLKAAINAARVAGVDISGNPVQDVDGLVILGAPLDDRYVSWTIDEWRAAVGGGVTRSSLGDANASKDCVVYDWTNYGVFLNRTCSPIKDVLIQMNNSDRLTKRDSDYFNYVQAYQCFNAGVTDGLISYSFALHALEHQPSGTCNMSRIDNSAIHLDFVTSAYVQYMGKWTSVSVSPYTAAKCTIECPSYNVFRVMGGMAGMGFHN
jgi:hypothetical protein